MKKIIPLLSILCVILAILIASWVMFKPTSTESDIIKKICNEPAERSTCKISHLFLCEKATEKIYRAVVSKEICTDQPIRYFNLKGNLLGLCAVPWRGEESERCEEFYSFECNPENLCKK